jgi:hypothetical protein
MEKKLAIGIPYTEEQANGKLKKGTHNFWMHHVQWAIECQFSDYKNMAYAFGRSNRNDNGEYKNFGKSGSVIKTGAGLYEQIEAANSIYYNTFNIKMLEKALYDLSVNKLELGDRIFVLRTEQMGAIQFHKAVLQEVSGWSTFYLDNSSTKVVEKVNSHYIAMR